MTFKRMSPAQKLSTLRSMSPTMRRAAAALLAQGRGDDLRTHGIGLSTLRALRDRGLVTFENFRAVRIPTRTGYRTETTFTVASAW